MKAQPQAKLICGNRCNCARWRAIGMLAGTHGYVGRRFTRIVRATDV